MPIQLDPFEYMRMIVTLMGTCYDRGCDYLEIGVEQGETFSRMVGIVSTATGVEPDPKWIYRNIPAREAIIIHRTTSDVFFKTLAKQYDLIFIDGDHEHEQVFRDIKNSLEHLKPWGLIACHDTFPRSKRMAELDRSGTCFKAMNDALAGRDGVAASVITIPCPLGVTLIQSRQFIQEPQE